MLQGGSTTAAKGKLMRLDSRLAITLCSALRFGATTAHEWVPVEGRELLGTSAPEWKGIRWIQGGPLDLSALRGKVVLLRFWLIDCPYCEKTAPALREFWSK